MEKNKREKISVEHIICIVTTISLVGLLAMQVFTRFVLHRSVAWSEEVSRIAFVWAVYGSMVYAAKLDKHVRITFFLMLMPAKVQKIILTIADAIWLALNLLITYQSVIYIIRLFNYPYISQTLGVNLVFTYFIVPIGFGLMSYRILRCMIGRFKEDIELHDSRMDL